MNNHIISHKKSVIDALRALNDLSGVALVLFVVNDDQRMVGTLTDGDIRRALIKGAGVNDSIETVMHRDFHYLRQGKGDDAEHIKEQKAKMMKLVPVLDADDHIVEVIDLQRFKTRLPIDAVLMAGGKGVRLRPLTEKTPKPLLEVGDKAIIDHNVDRLIDYGVRHISVTVNYLADQIIEHYREPRGGVKVECIKEPTFLGTIGAVQFVPKFYNDVVLVMNSDLLTNIDYEDFYLHFRQADADMSVAAVPYTINVPYGIFDLDGHNITGIEEKPAYNYFANAGIYLIKRHILEEIPKDTFYNATDLIETLIRQKKRVIRYPLSALWVDIGSKEEYTKAKELVKHIGSFS